MPDEEQALRPPEAGQPPEEIFKELVDRLKATRSEHGGVTFGSNVYSEDTRAVVLPEPVVEDEGKKRTYVVATAGGPKGLVFDKGGSSQDEQVSLAENKLRQDLSEVDKQGGSIEVVEGVGLGYISSSPKHPSEGICTGGKTLGTTFYKRSNNVGVYLSEVTEDIVVKAYEASKAMRAQTQLPPVDVQAKVQAANALMQRLGPKQ